jgi:hypothetical protein
MAGFGFAVLVGGLALLVGVATRLSVLDATAM